MCVIGFLTGIMATQRALPRGWNAESLLLWGAARGLCRGAGGPGRGRVYSLPHLPKNR